MTHPDQFIIDLFLLMLWAAALLAALLTLAAITTLTSTLTQYLWKKLTGRNSDPYRSQRP